MQASANLVGDSNDENNYLHQLLQVSKLFSSFSSFKIQLHKIGQSEGFLDKLLEPLLKIGLSLMKNVQKPLAKSFSILLGLTAAA